MDGRGPGGQAPGARAGQHRSLTFNPGGIFGASPAPSIPTWLATRFGLQYVGYSLTAAAALTLAGLLAIRETKDDDLRRTP